MIHPVAQPFERPRILYRYQSFDPEGNNLKAIRECYLWFSSAQHFNDPFDSAIKFNMDVRDPKLRLEWAIGIEQRDNPTWSWDKCRTHAQAQLQELDKNPALLEARQEYYIQTNYEKFGICSLTSIKDSILMWSHYADGHNGFVIGIDMKIMEVFQEHLAHYKTLLDLQPIIYEEQLPKINYFESMMSKNGERDIIRLLMTKSAHWSYEHEYRLILWDKVDFGFPIPADCISEIILGCDIQPDDERNLCKAILASSINPAVFKSRVHETDFRLIIEKNE